MTEDQKMRQAEEAVRAALRKHPEVRELEPERGFHACFEVPVSGDEILSRGLEAGPPGAAEGYRVLIGLVLRVEDDGRPGVTTGVDLEFFARWPERPEGEWLSATRVRDPEAGEWVQTVDPAAVRNLLHDVSPGWAEVVRAGTVRLALARRGEA